MWEIVGALLIVFVVIPILLQLIFIKEFWYFILGVIFFGGIIVLGFIHINTINNVHSCPQGWVWDYNNSMCNDPTFTW